MKAKLFLFAVKKNEENAVFSHLSLGESVSQVISKFNEDLTYLISNSNGDDDSLAISEILDYFSQCSLWCLGSIDFISGDLVSCKEEYFNLIDKLEVLKNGK